MFEIDEKTNQIRLVRGDTLLTDVAIATVSDDTYIPDPNDKLFFAMKKNFGDAYPLLVKQIPTDSLVLKLDPADTKQLPFGTYVYDIEVQLADGYVDTIVNGAKFILEKEVY